MRQSDLLWISLCALVMGMMGCGSPTSSTPTAAPVPFVEVILRDVHPLWGGREVRVRDDGTLWVRLVRAGGEAEERTAHLSPEEVAALGTLLEAHHFKGIEIPDWPGLPDEARPEIEVRWRSGERTVVAKWAGDVHPDFDAVYEWLLRLAKDNP